MCEIISKLTIKTPEWCHLRGFDAFMLTYFKPFSSVCIVYFEQVNISWVVTPTDFINYQNTMGRVTWGSIYTLMTKQYASMTKLNTFSVVTDPTESIKKNCYRIVQYIKGY